MNTHERQKVERQIGRLSVIERVGADRFRCGYCRCKFDGEAFYLAGGFCPGCSDLHPQA